MLEIIDYALINLYCDLKKNTELTKLFSINSVHC
jgi:hypothetical protein